MRNALSFVNRRVREYIYLMTTLPIAVLLFALVQVGFATVFVPLAVLFTLGLLTLMEPVARFEIRRTNRLLRTDFQVVDHWFGKPFFSWDGAKERATSLRSWMAIFYVFVALGVGILGFAFSLSGLAILAALLVGLGLMALDPFSRTFDVVAEGTSGAEITVNFSDTDFQFQLLATDGTDRFLRTGTIPLDAALTYALLIAAAVLLLWLSSGLSRSLARSVEGLLSGGYLPRFETELKRLTKELRISERDVREAMEQPSLQPELAELSLRQREILALMAQGKSNAGIAKALYITEGSVEKHVSNILAKLNLPVEEDSHRRVLAVLAFLGLRGPEGVAHSLGGSEIK